MATLINILLIIILLPIAFCTLLSIFVVCGLAIYAMVLGIGMKLMGMLDDKETKDE